MLEGPMRFLTFFAMILAPALAQSAISSLPQKTFLVRSTGWKSNSTLQVVLREQIASWTYLTQLDAQAPVNSTLTAQQQSLFSSNPEQFMADQARAGVIIGGRIVSSAVVLGQHSTPALYLLNQWGQLLRAALDRHTGAGQITPLPHHANALCEGGPNQLLFTSNGNRITSLDQNGNTTVLLASNGLDPATHGRITVLQKISANDNEFAAITTQQKFIRFRVAPSLRILTEVSFAGPGGPPGGPNTFQYFLNVAGARFGIQLEFNPMRLDISNLRAQMLANQTKAWVVLQGPSAGSAMGHSYYAVSIDYASGKADGFSRIWGSATSRIVPQQILDFDGSEIILRTGDDYESAFSLNPPAVLGDFFHSKNPHAAEFEEVHHPRTGLTWLPTHRLSQPIIAAASGGRVGSGATNSTAVWSPSAAELQAAEAYIRRQAAPVGATSMLAPQMELWKVLRVINLGDQLRLDMLDAFNQGKLSLGDVVKGKNPLNGQDILEVRTGANEDRIIDSSHFVDAVARARHCVAALTP